jgi:hypothetical protein
MNTTRTLESSSTDVESQIHSEEVRENVQRISSILKHSESSSLNDDLLACYIKMFIMFIISVFIIPFVVCNLYYAYSDKSCVNENAGKLDVNLFDYLVVDGIFGAVVAIVWFLVICKSDFIGERELSVGNWFIVALITGIGTIFGIAWTITGAIIFWSLMDNDLCDKGIYNYVFAQLIIKLVGYGIGILKNKSEKNK